MRLVLSALLWPGLLAGCIWLTHLGIQADRTVLFFNLTYFGLAALLLLLERVMPHERAWQRSDGQLPADLLHTVLNKSVVQVMVVMGAALGISEAVSPDGGASWPTAWPLWAQVLLGLIIAEFGFYWAHRLKHEWAPLWPYHAVHHSVTRLWIVNTGRFHFGDTLLAIAFSQPLLFLAGAPGPIFLYVASITAFCGLLTHCNVEMRCGPLNRIFNTPETHRWHHSPDLAEGNRNYGENFLLWDQLFRTWFCPAGRRPPAAIGIREAMPRGFLGQLAAPFVWRRLQARPALPLMPRIPQGLEAAE